jgi:hypothetical protein
VNLTWLDGEIDAFQNGLFIYRCVKVIDFDEVTCLSHDSKLL